MRAAVLASARLAKEKPTRRYAKPRWRADKEGISSRQQLDRLRQEFWDTAPAYGGAPEAWAALKAAAESPDIETARVILEAAGLVVVRPDMTVVYDERGARYELFKYLFEPEDAQGLLAVEDAPAEEANAKAAAVVAGSAAAAAATPGSGGGGAG